MEMALNLHLFFFLLFLSSFGKSISDEAFIGKLCAESQHHDLCVSMLVDNHHHPGVESIDHDCNDSACVAQLSLDVAWWNAIDVQDHILYLLSQRLQVEVAEVSALSRCYELYTTAKRVINKAGRDVREKNFRSAWDLIGIAEDVAGQCERQFGGGPTPLTTKNKFFENVCDVTWEMLDLLVTAKR